MTVISRNKQNYDYPNSNNNSDVESLNLTSEATDTESVNSEPLQSLPCNVQNVGTKISIYEEFGCVKKNCGKRKQRRIRNCSELRTLVEEYEDDEHMVRLMEDYKSPFMRLMENQAALMYWKKFTAMPEEEQAEFINFIPMSKQSSYNETVTEEPSIKISSKIKRAMKIKKTLPVDLIKKIESELINYFKIDPEGVYFSTPVTSFERLLLHAIAQYHNLRSISYLGDSIRNVEVHVIKKSWAPMEIPFFDFVEKLRQ